MPQRLRKMEEKYDDFHAEILVCDAKPLMDRRPEIPALTRQPILRNKRADKNTVRKLDLSGPPLPLPFSLEPTQWSGNYLQDYGLRGW